MKDRSSWWMLLCCLLPLFLIFLAPLLGLVGSNPLFLYILMMFVCSFMMMGGHRHNDDEADQGKGEDGEHKDHKQGGHHGCH